MRENVLWKITTQNSSFGLEPKACFSKVPVVTGSEKYLIFILLLLLLFWFISAFTFSIRILVILDLGKLKYQKLPQNIMVVELVSTLLLLICTRL